MTQDQKNVIRAYVIDWLSRGKDEGYTGAELSRKTGVSDSYISNVKTGKGPQPDDGQWRKLQAFFASKNSHIDSFNYLAGKEAFESALNKQNRVGIDGFSGAGKSYCARKLASENPNIIVITGRNSMRHRNMLYKIAEKLFASDTMETKYKRLSTFELEDAIVDKITDSKNKKLLIFDECELVPDATFLGILTLCNILENKCGIALVGIIKDKLAKLAAREKQGMPQMNRRFDITWVNMLRPKQAKMAEWCIERGVTDEETIDYIINRAKEYGAFTTMLNACINGGMNRGDLEKQYGRLPESQDHNHKRRQKP